MISVLMTSFLSLISLYWSAYACVYGPFRLVSPTLLVYTLHCNDLRRVLLFTHRFTFLVFAGACALAYFWATYYVPETANISLEEIDKLFKSSAGREEGMIKDQVSRFVAASALLFILADRQIRLGPRLRENLGLRTSCGRFLMINNIVNMEKALKPGLTGVCFVYTIVYDLCSIYTLLNPDHISI
jgi:hypothetical protein